MDFIPFTTMRTKSSNLTRMSQRQNLNGLTINCHIRRNAIAIPFFIFLQRFVIHISNDIEKLFDRNITQQYQQLCFRFFQFSNYFFTAFAIAEFTWALGDSHFIQTIFFSNLFVFPFNGINLTIIQPCFWEQIAEPCILTSKAQWSQDMLIEHLCRWPIKSHISRF